MKRRRCYITGDTVKVRGRKREREKRETWGRKEGGGKEELGESKETRKGR